MSVTEHLMRPGNGSVSFVSDVPLSVTDKIRKLVDENYGSGAVGAHIVITNARITSLESVSDAYILGSAIYTGVITARPSRTSLEFAGIGTWLDTYADNAVTHATDGPSACIGNIWYALSGSASGANGFTTGTVNATGTSDISVRVFPAHSATMRQILDKSAELGGWEYRIMPDFTVDAATQANLFDSGSVVVTRKTEGPDGVYRGVDGGLLDQALTQLGPNLATKAVALAEGDGLSIVKGSDTQTLNLDAPDGSTPVLIKVFSTPSEESANANTAASNFLNLQGMRRAVNVSSSTHHLPRLVTPGDTVYVWDVDSGLYDTTNEIQYRGETIHPAAVRLLSYTWPIEEGYGVYIRSNAATPTYIDVTDWVEFENGDTWWTVGDWNPPSHGPVNRTNPEIEERVASVAWTSFSPTITQSGSVSNTAVYAKYKVVDNTCYVVIYTDTTAAGTGGNNVVLTLPVEAASGSLMPVGSGYAFDISTTTTYPGIWVTTSTTTAILQVGSSTSAAFGNTPNVALASNDRLFANLTYETA